MKYLIPFIYIAKNGFGEYSLPSRFYKQRGESFKDPSFSGCSFLVAKEAMNAGHSILEFPRCLDSLAKALQKTGEAEKRVILAHPRMYCRKSKEEVAIHDHLHDALTPGTKLVYLVDNKAHEKEVEDMIPKDKKHQVEFEEKTSKFESPSFMQGVLERV